MLIGSRMFQLSAWFTFLCFALASGQFRQFKAREAVTMNLSMELAGRFLRQERQPWEGSNGELHSFA